VYAQFMARSGNWRRLFDPGAGLVQPRSESGAFLPRAPADTEDFVEGSAAQYTFAVPHDPAALFEALGGLAAARARLDDFFAELNAGPASARAYLGNEPTFGTPWLYDWAGQPHRAQALARRALLELYADSPDGLPGNDDLGAMASWWVLAALGLYPAVPGTDVLALNSPLFPHARLRTGSGVVRIDAPRAAPSRPYVHGLRLRGRRWPRAWIRYRSLSRGARLLFDLRARPDPRFGSSAAQAPPSFAPDLPLRCGRGR